MFALAEMAGELDVDRLEAEMPSRLMVEWSHYLRWRNSGGAQKTKHFATTDDEVRNMLMSAIGGRR